MRLHLFFLIFILLSIDASAYWRTYQNDLRNAGIANGTGYFPLKTANFSDDSLGTDFQPLTEDLNADGKNEIVIFSNSSLVVFNPTLAILNQAKIGGILGQPALFNFDNDSLIEIVFNARQNSSDYFFAYQFNNSDLKQEFNITLPNEANFSGIKCLGLNGTNACVFKDAKNYIHVVNMSSKADSSYNTSIYEERRQTVPAIGDIDNDGNQEAIFWFNEDNRSGYGFLVFDLNARSLDTGFNNSGIVDNIFSPGVTGVGIQFEHFELKGHPVLVDLNNDNKLEIAGSVFYDSTGGSGETSVDQYTELFVFSGNGSKLFSKCEMNAVANVGCNDGDNIVDKWEGTNPFVLDFDKNGIDDICFIKDEKASGQFKHMSLNCYNYSGDEIANVKITDSDTVKGAVLADMNNDGSKEVITRDSIYLLNGTSIFDFFLSNTNPIAADVDGNNGLDLVYTFGSQTKVLLDNANYSVDLSVFDISFSRFNSSHINISSIIKNTGQVEVNNIKAIMYNTETLENRTAILDIRRNGNFTFSALLGLKEREKVMVSVDFDNEINESNEDNNFAVKEFIDLPHVFVDAINLEPSLVQSEFRNYIKNKLTSGYYTENENEADIKIYIGKNNPVNLVNNIKTLDEFEFGYDFGNVIFNDKIGANPYAGLVGAFDDDGIKVMVVGNEIEGDIIGVKKFIENQVLLLNAKGKEAVFIDDEDADAVKVFDYLHLGGNNGHYNADNEQFRKIVRNSLNGEMFNVFDKSVVSGNGITLRLRNLKPNISSDYLEYLNSTGMPVYMPVVLAHGLFSNLTTWEVLGAELSNIGRDTWLIEITGGPGQDCDSCIDYTFYNLTDVFVPALLNGVLTFTGKEQIQYVGFSNGCRSALDSLERNMFDSNKVETFVAVGCPGAFEGFDIGASGIKLIDDRINRNLQDKKHISFKDLFITGIFNFNTVSKNTEKISMNLWRQYDNWISSNEDKQPGNITINNFVIVHGNAAGTSDIIVTILDEKHIYNNTKINNTKKRFNVFATHIDLDGRSTTKNLIKKSINKEELSFFEKNINLIESS